MSFSRKTENFYEVLQNLQIFLSILQKSRKKVHNHPKKVSISQNRGIFYAISQKYSNFCWIFPSRIPQKSVNSHRVVMLMDVFNRNHQVSHPIAGHEKRTHGDCRITNLHLHPGNRLHISL